MVRLARFVVSGPKQHVIQRGTTILPIVRGSAVRAHRRLPAAERSASVEQFDGTAVGLGGDARAVADLPFDELGGGAVGHGSGVTFRRYRPGRGRTPPAWPPPAGHRPG